MPRALDKESEVNFKTNYKISKGRIGIYSNYKSCLFLLSSHLNGVLVAQCVREVGPVCLVIEKMSLASIFTAATIQPAPLHVHKETNEVLRGVGVLGHH